ncbi:MAG: hypothetical protein NXH99_01440 [Rhodobacteraceae bacterium]|nr:hypothetical protein [Paracoccaceae bacterium]
MAKHLLLKTGRFYFRRRIPKRLHLQLGSSDLVVALPACSQHMAVQMARKASARFDLILLTEMTDQSIDRAKLHQIIRSEFELYLKERDWQNRGRFDNRQDERNEGLLEAAREDLRMKFWENAAVNVDLALQDEAIELKVGGPEYKELAMGFLRANVEALRISSARFRGDYTATPEDPLFIGNYVEPEPQTMSLAAACDAFKSEMVTNGHWQQDSERGYSDSLSVFCELVGDYRLASVGRRKIAEFVDQLRRLPRLRGKSNALRAKTLLELMADVENGVLDPISESKVEGHLNRIAAMFEWACRRGEISTNPCQGVYRAPRKTRRDRDAKSAWSVEQLARLFSSPIYRGRSSQSHRFKAGSLILRDEWYWLPLLLAFHPFRPEEAAQLEVADFQRIGEVWFCSIDGGVTRDEVVATGKRIKNLSSQRLMPMHSILHELGFEEFVSTQRKAKLGKVFPGLKQGGKAERYNNYFSKMFNQGIRSLGIEGVTVSGLRPTAITAMANAGIEETMRMRLSGHSLTGQSNRYVKELDIQKAKSAIDSIQYPGIDADYIRGA